MAKPTLPPVAEDKNGAIDVDHVNEEQVEQAESVREERIKKKKSKWNCCNCFCDIFNFCFGVEGGYELEEIEIQGFDNDHDIIGRNEIHVSLSYEAIDHHHDDTHHSSSNDHCVSSDFGNSTCDYGGADSGGDDCGGGDCGGGTD